MKRLLTPLIALSLVAPATGSARADDESGPRDRVVAVAIIAAPLVTVLGPMGPRDSEVVWPAERFAMQELIGIGWVVHPKFRFLLLGLFGETLTGLPPGADTWQLGGIAPIAMGTFGHFVIGGGPIVAYRSGGKQQADAGAVLLPGVSLPLGRGFALNIVAPTSVLLMNRRAASLGVAVGVAKVF
jgi:hypothetical protein